jgi:hypothetical protein
LTFGRHGGRPFNLITKFRAIAQAKRAYEMLADSHTQIVSQNWTSTHKIDSFLSELTAAEWSTVFGMFFSISPAAALRLFCV